MSEGSESRQNDGPGRCREALDFAGAELDDIFDCDDAVIKVQPTKAVRRKAHTILN